MNFLATILVEPCMYICVEKALQDRVASFEVLVDSLNVSRHTVQGQGDL